ncbi:MAG: 2Fe-2S iron-sulfur cluster-binding protein [Deltaproteobacteria bacterium]|nr:2Fe-2S iron-sulfur cluster-binding protein [Deltaproteobacteria bacterium]
MDKRMTTVSVSIDGRQLDVPYDARVLDIAREQGITIPTMCEHEHLKPYGVCRVCLVEMRQGRRKKLVPACVYTFREPVEIFTDSEWVRETRKWILAFMLARSPREKSNSGHGGGARRGRAARQAQGNRRGQP